MSGVVIKTWGAIKIAWVDSSCPGKATEAYKTRKVDGLGISPHNGYLVSDISFLKADVPDLNALILPYSQGLDLSPITQLHALRLLVIGESSKSIDLRSLINLEDLAIQWHSGIQLPNKDTPLRRLNLSKYKSKTNDFTDLPDYSRLEGIELIQGQLDSLHGIERFKYLSKCEFSYMPRLETVEPLVSTPVVELTFDRCKNIKDIKSLARCANLSTLRYLSCGDLESLSFLNKFKKLEEFRFVGTTIKDGDMMPLLQLKRVGFLAKRGYSHTPEEIQNKRYELGSKIIN